ncbi:MAG: MBL fold metallo-hydrolase [Planctomycetaceae bacterium]|nr:MBL fold metallo-hydrolase [Planctomycetaceae bacterium]
MIRSLSRRDFLRRSAVAGVALGAAAPLAWGDARSADEKVFKSHGPGEMWLKNSDKLIEQFIRPLPEGQRVNDQICSSRRLENVFYIDLGKHAVVIDSGFDHQVQHHLDNLESLGCDLSRVVAILATHSHVDHTGGVKKARERLKVPVVAHANAVEPITTGDRFRTAAEMPEIKGWKFDFPPCPVDLTIDHGDVIEIDDQRIDVLHLPGHTPDCVGYVWNGHFFTGDAVFGAGLIGWAHERWRSNYTDHADTILGLIQSGPDAQMFYCAHGPMLPYSVAVPEACLLTLKRLLANDADPCNHTPRAPRRTADVGPRVLQLPAA